MTHTKFQGNRPFGSGEEDFLRFLPYMGMAAILVMWLGPFEQTFVPSSHRLAQWFLRRRCLKSVDDDDGWRTTKAYLSYKLTKWAFGSGELKMKCNTGYWFRSWSISAPLYVSLCILNNIILFFWSEVIRFSILCLNQKIWCEFSDMSDITCVLAMWLQKTTRSPINNQKQKKWLWLISKYLFNLTCIS